MDADATADDHLRTALSLFTDERIVTIPAPVQLSCAYKGKTPPFKMQRFNGGDELLLVGMRSGKRDPIIFTLTPLNITEWDHAEIELSKLEKAVPTLARDMVDALGAYLAKKQAEAGEDDLDRLFIPSGVPLMSAVSTFQRGMAGLLVRLKEAAEAAAAREAEKAYADSEVWGTW